jgi:hypothetical protein
MNQSMIRRAARENGVEKQASFSIWPDRSGVVCLSVCLSVCLPFCSIPPNPSPHTHIHTHPKRRPTKIHAVLEGMDVVKEIEKLGSPSGAVAKKVTIADAGELPL